LRQGACTAGKPSPLNRKRFTHVCTVHSDYDDDFDFRETLRGVFEPRGFRAILAGTEKKPYAPCLPGSASGADGYAHAQADGLDTIRKVKRFRADLPCILLSAALDEKSFAKPNKCMRSPCCQAVSRQQINSAVDGALLVPTIGRLRIIRRPLTSPRRPR